MTTMFQGEVVRGFKVLLKSPRSNQITSLPCKGFAPFTGEQALKVMRSYSAKRPGVEVRAFTDGQYSGPEELTLEEMEEMFADLIIN